MSEWHEWDGNWQWYERDMGGGFVGRVGKDDLHVGEWWYIVEHRGQQNSLHEVATQGERYKSVIAAKRAAERIVSKLRP